MSDFQLTIEYRRLIQTFPGLPEGAGIYEMSNGSKRFFNCAPGRPSQMMPDYEAILKAESKQERIKKLGLHVCKEEKGDKE